jgi:ABC-type multidrug transport system ATPase subunit
MTARVAIPALELAQVSASVGSVGLLDRISFTAAAASLTVIAGPTGAGKTSLVRAITGMLAVSSGEVRVGGRPVGNVEAFDRDIAYVPQYDVLHDSLTVRAALDYTAALRLAETVGAANRTLRVREVMRDLRLQSLANQQIRSLSTGQRKRVAIASELLTRPTVIVLDEPTSSLDPGYEHSVMTTLRELADSGHCVVVVTHSATAIAASDRVVYLASGGWLAYVGTPEGAVTHFAAADVPELFTTLDRAAVPRWVSASSAPAAASATEATRHQWAVSPAHQLVTLARRYATGIRADRRHAAMLALQGLFLGILLWTFVSPNGLRPSRLVGGAPPSATGVAVLLALCMTWLGSANAVREIVKERGIVERERRAGLSVAAYVGSKLAVLGPVIAIEGAIVAGLGITRQGVPARGAALGSGFAEVVVAVALAGLCAVSLGLLVSAAVRTTDKAVAVLPVVVVTEFVLSGLQPSVTWVPGLAQLRDLAGAHWAVTAIEATVAGNAGQWWTAVAAMIGLTLAAASATTVLVERANRLRRQRPTIASRVAAARDALRHEESVRLVAVGLRCLAAVAVAVVGFHVVGVSTHGQHHTRVTVAAASQVAPASDINDFLNAGNFLPGAVGQAWSGMRTGLLLVEATTQAVVSP